MTIFTRLVRFSLALALAGAWIVFSPNVIAAVYDQSPIRYWDRPIRDVVSKWEDALLRGETLFEAGSQHAFLLDVLETLDIPVESQVLVFSHTSFQNSKISPKTPRALYFNQDHYVGWVQDGDIEIMTVDPGVGMNFYQLKVPGMDGATKAQVVRNESCLACHAGSSGNPYPGTLLFSTFTDADGTQLLRGDTKNIDHRSPLTERWAGWYVTGQWEGPRHRGNVWYADDWDLGPEIDPEKDQDFGAALADLTDVIDTSKYLRATSDVVALLVIEHQALAHNALMQAFGNSRIALYADDNYMVGEPLKPETQEVLDEEIDRLLRVFLFKNEAGLAEHRTGAGSAFREVFEKRGKTDNQGRSLRDFNLRDRLFEYRLSYMIYSDAFDNLPGILQDQFFIALREVLEQGQGTGDYPYLTADERQAIDEILRDTHPDYHPERVSSS